MEEAGSFDAWIFTYEQYVGRFNGTWIMLFIINEQYLFNERNKPTNTVQKKFRFQTVKVTIFSHEFDLTIIAM